MLCSCRRAGAGLIGLSLSYALSITEILNGVLTTSAETEQEMVSVERIQEYIQLPAQVSSTDLPFGIIEVLLRLSAECM